MNGNSLLIFIGSNQAVPEKLFTARLYCTGDQGSDEKSRNTSRRDDVDWGT